MSTAAAQPAVLSWMPFPVVGVPRIGEGVRLLDFDGLWGSYDVVDVWYQRSPLGDIWVPYIHVRKSGETEDSVPIAAPQPDIGELAAGATLASAVASRAVSR